MDSLSMRPIIEGKRETIRSAVTSGLLDWRLIRDGTYELVLKNGSGPMLFNLTEDPWEEHNVAQQHPDVVQRLMRLMQEVGAALPDA